MTAPELTDAEIELEFYERFFIEKGLEPYPVQEQALGPIFRGENVMVTVPTGTGKTLLAKAAIFRALKRGQTAAYTTPLRALTEEKFRELCDDFGEANVGFATGDYKVNPGAPVQVLVAEILWNKIYDDRVSVPADIVVMDEGHYFNEPERGYVWEQSLIGLDPRTQLVILSATVGAPENFCQWLYTTRRVPITLIRSDERKVPLYHEYREDYFIETVRQLNAAQDVPTIVFAFSRNGCFDYARLLKSCARFTTKEEQEEIEREVDVQLLPGGLALELRPLLLHGIGVHHAGILPRYRRLVEELTLRRLLKFVVSTETIAAGINLPAKRVLFPSLRKYMDGKARLLIPAEYHQMAGRAGRPQFDTEGIAITLAPEEVVQEFRREIKDLKKRGLSSIEEEKIRQKHYNKAKTAAKAKEDVVWDREAHTKLVEGEPAALRSRTKINAEQILAIGLPDLAAETLPGLELLAAPEGADSSGRVSASPNDTLPASQNLNIKTVIDNLLLPDHERREAHKRLAMITRNLQALGVLDEHGRQVKGEIIGQVRGIDGTFVYYFLMNHEPSFELYRGLCEFLIDHGVIQRLLDKKDIEAKKEWCRNRLRELRRENPHVAWEDVEEEYDRAFPRELTPVEKIHQAFIALVPHPELHGGKSPKNVWATMEDSEKGFVDFVEEHELQREEGNLFSYLSRVMKVAKQLHEVSKLDDFAGIEASIRARLVEIDPRVANER